MKKTVKTVFPFGLLSASLIFFFNPNIQIVDILPDLFGYMLLIWGLYCLGDLNGDIGEARERLKKMFAVEAAKFVTFLMIFGGLVTPQERGTFTLLATLVFCVIELLILVPAVYSLFAGLMQLANKYGSEAIFATRPKKLPQEPRRGFRNEAQKRAFDKRVARVRYKNERQRCALEKLRTVTMAFIFAKPIMALFPEFSALSSTEYNEGLIDFYQFVTLFRGFAVIVLLPFALYWAYRVLKFLRALRRDTAFCSTCLAHYCDEILPNTDLFTQRAVKLSLSVMGLGVFFSLDFYLEYYNILPDVLCAAFIFAGLWMLRKYVTCHKPAMLAAVMYGLISVVTSGLTVRFNTAFYFNAIYKDDAAALTYYGACALTVLENLLFVLMLVLVARVMEQMVIRYSGFSIAGAAGTVGKERVSRVHAGLKKTIYIFLGAGTASALTGVLYEVFKPQVPYIWMIDFAVALIFIYLFYRSTWEIREQIEYKYMLS